MPTSTPSASAPGRTPPRCWPPWDTTSRTSTCRCRARRSPTFETCWAVLTAFSPAPPGRESQLRPLTRWLSAKGDAVTGPEFGLALGAMRRYAADCLDALAAYDAVLTPTLAVPPLPVGALRDDDDPAADFEAQKAFTPWTSAWNVTGMPAVSLPAALDAVRPPRGCDARRAAGGGGAAAVAGGPGRGCRALVGSPPTWLVILRVLRRRRFRPSASRCCPRGS